MFNTFLDSAIKLEQEKSTKDMIYQQQQQANSPVIESKSLDNSLIILFNLALYVLYLFKKLI